MDTTGNEIGEKIQRNLKTPSNGANEVQGFSDFDFHSSRGSRESGRMFTVDDPGPPNLETNQLLSDQDPFKQSNFSPEKVQLNQWGILGNGLCPVGERIQYMPFNMLSPGSPQGFQLQAFHYFVVIDFEATCDKEKIPQPQEIIEFPSVLVNSVTGQLEASFQTYVRPAYHQTLTEFCKELTGIKQIQVDRGVSLSEALLMHDKWLEEKGIKHTNFAIVTWSNWDCRVMLESECRFKRIRKPPYFNRWINLKVPFHEVFGGARCNLKQAVQLAGLPWEGRAHCGLDDARNTANLLALIMRRGFRFSITNSLIWETSDNPTLCQPAARMPVSPLLPPRKMVALAGQPPPFHSFLNNERKTCFCGVMSNKCIVAMLPGPKHARFFFRCGNWTPARGGRCPYFEWAS